MRVYIEKANGEFRVPAKDGYEDGAYYTDDKEEAMDAAKRMYGDDVDIKFKSVFEFVGGKYEKYRPKTKKNESLSESNGYIAFYGGKQVEVTADTSYKAQQEALAKFQKLFPRKKVKGYDITVKIAEKDGKQVTTHCESVKSWKVMIDGKDSGIIETNYKYASDYYKKREDETGKKYKLVPVNLDEPKTAKNESNVSKVMKTLAQPTIKEAARPLHTIASEIKKDWKQVNYAAKPYLDAMMALDSVNDKYGHDSGRSVVAYFLSNARSWTGEVAKEIKKELNKMIK